jgi:hypothetical protein
MGDNAKIRVDVEGAAEAERKLNKLKESFKSFGREMGSALTGAITNLGSVAAQLTHIDPSALASKFREFRGSITEFSIAAGRSVEQMKSSFSTLSKKGLLPDDQLAAFSKTLAKTTYDFHDSGKALIALRAEGVATGRSLEEMAPIAETIHNAFGETFDELPQTLGDIRAVAEELGTTGGPAALQDQIASLGSMLSEVSIKGTADAKELIAVLGSFGKNLKPEQQKKVQQELVGTFVQGGEQLRRNLGIKTDDFYDENGQVKLNAANLKKLRDFNVKQAGGNVAEARRRSALVHGGMYSAALYNSNLDADVQNARDAVRSAAPEQAMSSLLGSQHGVETGKQNEREQRAREEVGGLTNAAQQKMADLAPADPIVRAITMGFASVVASNLLGKGVSSALEAGFKSIAPMFASSATTAAASGGGAPVASMALPAGAAIGGPAALASVGLAAVAAHDALIDPIADGMKKGVQQDKDDFAAGRKRRVSKFFGLYQPVESVPPEQQAQAAREYAAQLAAAKGGASQKQDVKVTIVNATGMPLNVVNAEKGNAGRQ